MSNLNHNKMKPNHIFTDFDDVNNPWYLTKNGLYPLSQCTLIGSLLVTPTHVERNFVTFDNFKHIDDSKGHLIDVEEDKSGTCTKVGWTHLTYEMEFGRFIKSIGEWMDSYCYYEINNNRTVIEYR